MPASGSSSIYLDGIPAGGTKDISIDLNARADLVQKPYSIAMSMKYEDGNATQFESASSLAIPVKQAARFELSDIEVAPGIRCCWRRSKYYLQSLQYRTNQALQM